MRTSAATALALLRGYLPDAARERVDARVGSNRRAPEGRARHGPPAERQQPGPSADVAGHRLNSLRRCHG